jgi:hypothetical protein
MAKDFNNIDFNNPEDLNDFWNAMECANNMSILHTDCPINSREDFADYFTDLGEFLHYVREEYSYEQGDYRYTLFIDKDGNIVIEEEPINDLVVLFDTTIHKYAVDESWRYIAMDWFDTVCGSSIWEM